MKKEVFLEKVLAVHGNKYDYSLVPDEFPQKDKITIICPKHGEFNMTAGNLIWNKRGCAKCGFEYVAGLKKEKYRQHFFAMAPVLHSFKYDYSLVEYITSEIKVKIVCPVHGVFEQTPEVHMRGNGCRKCGTEVSSRKQKYSSIDFIEVARQVHGDIFDYSELNFKSYQENVDIICKVHGKFSQNPNNHISGNGCPSCTAEMLRERFKMPEQEFLRRVADNFPEYDLSMCEYTHNKDNITVGCPIHGEFTKRAWSLVKGFGCPKCSASKCGFKSKKKGTLYILKITDDVYKFGITNDLETRFRGIQRKCCFDIELLYTFNFEDGQQARLAEAEIIDSDIERNLINRCDMKTGYTETFYAKDLTKVLDIVYKYKPA